MINDVLKLKFPGLLSAATLSVAAAMAVAPAAAQAQSTAPKPAATAQPQPAAAAGAAAQGTVVARVGSATIGQADVEQMLRGMSESDRAQIKTNRAGLENFLRERLAGEAVLREAEQKKWADRPEVKTRIDAAVREVTSRVIIDSYLASVAPVPASYPSDDELKAAYEQGKANFALPASYHVAQIYLAAPQNDAAQVSRARAQAQQLATQAKSGDFAALAKTWSQDGRSAANGGDVGSLPLAQIFPEGRDTLGKMKPGQVSDPVQSATGFHIMKLVDIQPARTATLDEVKPRLQAALRQQRQEQLVQSYLANMLRSGAVTIDNAALDAVLSKVN